MIIKIYDKDFVALTTLVDTNSASDFNSLNYKNQVNGVGDASFVVRINNSKINTTTIKHYNKVEILDNDGTARWVGVIASKDITLDIITVKCYGLAYMLEKRLTGDAEQHAGQANTEISEILTSANATEDTGITEGTLDVTTAVDATFTRAKALVAIKAIADSVGAQYTVKPDRKLYVQQLVGQDLSGSVFFRYEKSNTEQANVLQFRIGDDGKAVISKSYGKGNGLNSIYEDTGIKNEFGLIEDFKSFNEANDQDTLDNLTANNTQNGELSPTIALSPNVGDNFEAGDIVHISLNNGFINVNTDYQILEKAVKITNGQKLITVKLNLEVKDFIHDFKAIKDTVESIDRKVVATPSSSGDMTKAVYDPTAKNADAFSMGNMTETATKKIMTDTERTKLGNQSGVNTGDQDLSSLAPKDNPTFTTKVTTPALKVTTGAGAGKILVSDANGDLTLQTPASGGASVLEIQVFS